MFGPLCRNTHSRHPIRRPTAECRWKSINLCSFWHSAQLHIYQLCACARHIYQFVLIRWHRGQVPRVQWERRDQGNYLLIISCGLPIPSSHHSSQTYHFVIPSDRSDAPNDRPGLLDFCLKWQEESKYDEDIENHPFLLLLDTVCWKTFLSIINRRFHWKALTLCAH